MDKEIKIQSNLTEIENDSRNRLLFFSTEISLDVLFALSLPVFLRRHQQLKHTNIIDVFKKLVSELNDECFSNITYEEFCKLFDHVNGDRGIREICEYTYGSQISHDGEDLSRAINTFVQLVGDRIRNSDDEAELRAIRAKRMSEENESYKMEKASLINRMENMAIDYEEKVREYDRVKKHYEEQVENVYREADFYKVRTEAKNKHDMLVYFKYVENNLDELEKLMEEKKKKLVALKDTNIGVIEPIKKEILKKTVSLKMTNIRFSNDMLLRHKNKINLQQSIESKTNSLNILKEKVTSMEIYLSELEESEEMYLKEELYDKLDAIKEKIALRVIKKFLIPYIHIKFETKRAMLKNKKKNKKKK